MLHSFLLGAFITFCYDIFRILRRIIPHGIFWISLEDLIFWVMATGGIFYLLYYENNGMFRWFAVISAAAGMLLYKKTLSLGFVSLVSGAVNGTLRFLRKILWRLTAPARRFLRWSKRIAARSARRAAVEVRVRSRELRRRLSSRKISLRKLNSRLTAWKKELKIKCTGWKKKRCDQ